MAIRSLTDPSPSNYAVFFHHGYYRHVLWTTFKEAGIVTAATALLGYPYAYLMHLAGRRAKIVLGAIVLIPLWSSLLVRTYAWTVLLQYTGVVNTVLHRLGLIDQPLTLMRNTLGVTIGMTHVLLPIMVLPIFAAMRRVEPELTAAAMGLGARRAAAFRRVFFPLTLPGLLAGSLLVFVLALGYYITPALLGSPQNEMFSELIVQQFSTFLNFGVGSALAMILLAVTLLVVGVGSRIINVGRAVGYGSE